MKGVYKMNKLTFDEKLDELYKRLKRNKRITRKDKFSNGASMYTWFYNTRYKLKNTPSKKALFILSSFGNFFDDIFNERKREVYEYLIENKKRPNGSVLFKNGVSMYNFVRDHKEKLFYLAFIGDEEARLIFDYWDGSEQEKIDFAVKVYNKYSKMKINKKLMKIAVGNKEEMESLILDNEGVKECSIQKKK